MEKSKKLECLMTAGRLEMGRRVTMPAGAACTPTGGGLGHELINVVHSALVDFVSDCVRRA